MNIPYLLKTKIKKLTSSKSEIDLQEASDRIKSGIWFRGMNVWILACAIVIASLGLNVNSTAVIIGAMLISPVMGPIIGMGLAFGTKDATLLNASIKNLLIMVFISLMVSFAYFVLTPLSLADPTELQARTSPTIYDVFIAFFGGLAGILENSRKTRGTVLSGVAIATALMPPLCTAGYGLATLNFRFFLGAMYLFVINTIFITTATYIGVKTLHYPPVKNVDIRITNRHKRAITAFFLILLLPSIVSAYYLVKENNFTSAARRFVSENRLIGKTYVYNYNLVSHGRKVLLQLAGEPLSPESRQALFQNARKAGIDSTQIILVDDVIGMTNDQMNSVLEMAYERTDESFLARDAYLEQLRKKIDRVDSLITVLQSQIPEARSPKDSSSKEENPMPDVGNSFEEKRIGSLPK